MGGSVQTKRKTKLEEIKGCLIEGIHRSAVSLDINGISENVSSVQWVRGAGTESGCGINI